MSQRGISFRLNTHITTIAIIIIAIIVYLNYSFSNKVLVSKIEEGAINESNLVISKISRITIGTEEIVRNVSDQALYYYKHNDLDLFLSQLKQSNQIVENIRVELLDTVNNQILKFSSNDFDKAYCKNDSASLNQLRILINSYEIKQGKGVWSKPFYCIRDTTHLLVSYRLPFNYPGENKIAGLVSCEISLRMMSKMLSEIKIAESGFAFIIDRSGDFITHPNVDWILKKNLFDNSSTIFKLNSKQIEAKIKQGRSGAGEGISEFQNNQTAWFYFAPLPNTGWSVIIVILKKELFEKLDDIFREIIYVSIFGILILFLLNIFVFRKILDPLVRITYAIQRFTSPQSPVKERGNEINMLAESLENWQSKYGGLIDDQSKKATEKMKFDRDLKSAHEIQQNIVPNGNPTFEDHPEIELNAILKPAEVIGGDLYDYLFIGKNHLLIAIGDVSGKGIPASLFMAIASTLIKSNAKILSSNAIVSRVNKELCERNSNQYFVTLFLGIIDLQIGVLDYCNAAHNYPYLLHSDGTLKTLSKSHGLPLGIYKDKTYKNSIIDLSFGDNIILYTDGVIDAKNISNQHYGNERLEENLKNMNGLNSEEIVEKVLKSIQLFEGGSAQADDISIMSVKYLKK